MLGEIRNVDALRFTNKLFRDFYSKLYIQLVHKAPTILGFVYRNSDEPWKTDRMRLMLDRLNTRVARAFHRQASSRTSPSAPISCPRKSFRT